MLGLDIMVDFCYILFMNDKVGDQQKEQSIRSEFPKDKFEDAVKVAQAIEDNNSGNPLPPQEVAIALGRSPGSSDFRILLSSSIKYGLTTGSFNSSRIIITDLGKDIVEPKDEKTRKIAIANAILKPELFSKIFDYYKGKKIPEKSFFGNTLARDFGIPKKQTDIFVEIFMANTKYLGLIKETTTGPWFASEVSSTTLVKESEVKENKEEDNREQQTVSEDSVSDKVFGSNIGENSTPSLPQPKRPSAIFLGHGKNQKPLDQLIKILDEYGIPHKEAIGEANAGRPIPTKVADTMHECGAAILIFTADEKFQDQNGNEIWRPSENVVHELGAASVLYDNRIILFKEDVVSLASNFSGIGYISFEKDKLSDKGIDLFRELVSFKLVNITVGS